MVSKTLFVLMLLHFGVCLLLLALSGFDGGILTIRGGAAAALTWRFSSVLESLHHAGSTRAPRRCSRFGPEPTDESEGRAWQGLSKSDLDSQLRSFRLV